MSTVYTIAKITLFRNCLSVNYVKGFDSMHLSEDKFIVQMNEMKQQLYRIAFLYLKNESSALEAVDETIYLAYKNLKKLREPQFFKSWVTRILINECKKDLRHKKKEELLEIFPEQGQEDYDALPLNDSGCSMCISL